MKKKSCLLSLLILLCGCIGGVDGDTALPSHFVAVFRGDSSPDYRIIGDKREASHRFTPCSTFKIISTAMLLDSGAAELDTRLGYDGTEYSMPEWNKDVTLLEAFRYSCVPYYRKAVLLLDKSYIQECLNALNYGNCDIGGTGRVADELFWLESSLAISPEEQIEVLHRIFTLGQYSARRRRSRSNSVCTLVNLSREHYMVKPALVVIMTPVAWRPGMLALSI